jgi:type 1 glutamine amidotransferase
VIDDDHIVSEGCDDFEVVGGDELYYMHMFDDVRVLMEATTQGEARGFAERTWNSGMTHPVLYEKKIENGAILYCTLGHRRGHWDMEPLTNYYKKEELGAWELPIFDRILRNSIKWLQEK